MDMLQNIQANHGIELSRCQLAGILDHAHRTLQMLKDAPGKCTVQFRDLEIGDIETALRQERAIEAGAVSEGQNGPRPIRAPVEEIAHPLTHRKFFGVPVPGN